MRPAEKQATAETRKTKGDRSIQNNTQPGTLWLGERLCENRINELYPSAEKCSETYYMASFHVRPNKLFTAAPMLKTKDVNQNPLTLSPRGVPTFSNENCRVVAVTPENNVATVDRFRRLAAACF